MNQLDAPIGYMEPEGGPSSSFGSYLDALYDNRRLIALVTALMLAIGTTYALLAEPVYRADILVQVEESTTSAKSMLGDISSMFDVKTEASSEMEVLRSRLVAGRVVSALSLTIDAQPRYLPLVGRFFADRATQLSNPLPLGYVTGTERIAVAQFDVPDKLYGRPFILTARPGNTYHLSGRDIELNGTVGVALNVNTPDGPLSLLVNSINGKPGAAFILRRYSWLSTEEKLREKLSIAEKGKQSDVISVTLDGPDPVKTAAILNAIGTEYVLQNVQRKSEEAERSIRFLDAQLPDLKSQLERSENRFNTYRAEKGTLNLDEEATALLQRSVDAQSRLTTLKQKRDELMARYEPDHPAVKAIDAQLQTAQADISGIDKSTRELPPLEQQVLRLQRDVEVGTELYTNLLNTQEQLRLVKAGKVGNVRLVDTAAIPEEPIRPKRALVIGGSLMFGLLIGVGVAFSRRRMFDTIEDPVEVEHFSSLPIYATIPHSREEASLTKLRRTANAPSRDLILANHAAMDPALESLRSFRTALEFTMTDVRNRMVFITGPTPGIGKSFISLNLAAVLGAAGKRVLLVDADLRRSGLRRVLPVERGPGLVDLLRDTHDVTDVLHRDVLRGVDYVATGSVAENASDELFDSDLRSIVSKMGAAYDLVICDGPPVLAAPDAAQLAGNAGATFLVVRQGLTKHGEIKESIRRLRQVGVSPRGLIFNGLSARPGRYTYGYGRYRHNQDSYAYYGKD
jgi:tyrosine-protein kinase Etk/Wzc